MSALIIYSLPYWYTTPPPALELKPSVASSTSSRLTSSSRILSGLILIWYSGASPPMTDTCDTPPRASSRGLMVVSARRRNSSSEVESARRPIIIISPKIDDCGPITGLSTPSGRLSAAASRRSLTIWRAVYISVPQSNSTHTTEKPVVEVERTRRTPVLPLTAVSIG